MIDVFPQIAALQPSDPLPMSACMGNDPATIWLHAVGDIILLAAYVLLPLSAIVILFYFRTRTHRWITAMIAAFLVLDASTYLFHFLGLWQANYWLGGIFKMITAMLSLVIAIFIGPVLLFQAATDPSPKRRADDPKPTIPTA